MTVLKLAVQPSPPSSSQVPGHLSLPPPITSRNLTGAITASAALLRGLDGKLGIYFAFPDISVRTEGTYTLKFSFTILPIMHGQEMRPRQQTSSVQATVFSEHFTIYTAKRFPGMTGSTELSKILADQGLRIPLRKEPRVSGNSRRASDSSQNQSQSQHDVEMEDE
ncbi:hypothetical protein BGW38_003375 [Lunasporangiospora selenospora]|uniref:Velvet domain-containing protein n=1 Tax=Lunasporangiospora selenospora TaxID=979761 RepID=A0A9P6KCW4_9FUNG|nr:hypothetical protein BGW38_003375 [Lunasporangiospora selenospora]